MRKRKKYTENQQGWEQALYLALDRGLFNRESSLSFWDHLTEEIWPDPERSVSSYIREYLVNGCKLYLMPTPSFPLPESIQPSFEDFWYFGLEFPGQTDIRVLINKARRGMGMDDSWNDAYILDDAPFDFRLKQILKEDFKLENLRLGNQRQ